MTNIKLTHEITVDGEFYRISKDNFTERVLWVENGSEPKEVLKRAIEYYNKLKESVLNPYQTEVLLEENI